MEKDVVKNFIMKRISENKEIFSKEERNVASEGTLVKKAYLLGLNDGIELVSKD